jgi:NADH-ubiquinone oxidoreductase chain 5
MIVLASITKRAQLPFSYWLPMAIAAPTPVSALVHSSTLVTAGVYLIIRFNKILLMRWAGELFKIAVLTIFISGLIANFEFDLKKIIALSTLRQLGLMIIILRLGMGILSFFHLLTHAIFKSILFICAGIIIHSINNNQDIRVYGGLNEYLPFTIIRFYISRLSLCGFPFLSGFYSKDLIIELIYLNKISYISLFLIIFSLGFTISYSFRLFYYLFFYEIKFMRANNIKESFKINLSIIFLIFLSILGGRNL